MNGQRARQDTRPNSMRLTSIEEDTLVEVIIDLDSRGFPPRLSGVEEMANILLEERAGGRVGKH